MNLLSVTSNLEVHPCIYHAATSKCHSINCILVIQRFFLSLIGEKQLRFRRLKEAFSDPMTEVYLLFFQATMPVFTTFNLLLQREQSSIFLLHDEV